MKFTLNGQEVDAQSATPDTPLLYVLRNDMPTLPADMHLPEALGIFSRPHCGESLALVNPDNDHLLGVVNKTDLYLVLSEIMRREKLQ